jgi:hypothetical protein
LYRGWNLNLFLLPGLENIFLFLAAKNKNKQFLGKSNIKLPACVDFRDVSILVPRASRPHASSLGPGTNRTGTARKLALISNAHGN